MTNVVSYYSDTVSIYIYIYSCIYRARYQAIASLLPHVGAETFLHIQPDAITTLIHGLKLRDIGAHCSALIATFLRTLLQERLSKVALGQEKANETVADVAVTSDVAAKLEVRSVWVEALIDALCSSDEKVRVTTSDYLISELLKFDGAAGPHLIERINKRVYDKSLSYSLGLWGLLSICLQCRQLSLPGQRIATGDATLSTATTGATPYISNVVTSQDILQACHHADINYRLLGLTVLTTSEQSVAPLDPSELLILQQALQYSLKSSYAVDQQNIVRVLKNIVSRVCELRRISLRDKGKAVARLQALQLQCRACEAKILASNASIDLLSIDVPVGECDTDETSYPALSKQYKVLGECADKLTLYNTHLTQYHDFFAWLSRELHHLVHPSVTSDKQTMGLEVLSALYEYSQTLNNPSLGRILATDSMTKSVINMINSNWDRTRRLASDIILRFPTPLPGYGSLNAVNALFQIAFMLCGSGRQREAESGAMLVQGIYSVYSVQLSWTVKDFANDASSMHPVSILYTDISPASKSDLKTTQHDSCIRYITHLTTSLQHRLDVLEVTFNSLGRSIATFLEGITNHASLLEPSQAAVASGSEDSTQSSPSLAHGLVLALRYCIECSYQRHLLQFDSTTDASQYTEWQGLIGRIKELTMRALHIAMIIVAEAKSDDVFSSHHTIPGSGLATVPEGATLVEGSKGAVNSSSISNSFTLVATYVNANSNVGSSSLGVDNSEQERDNETQRSVVAAWLLVKEATSLLSTLVEVSCYSLSTASSQASSPPPPLMSYNDIADVGHCILDALNRLKHIGAISEAHAALQRVVEALLRYTSTDLKPYFNLIAPV